MKTFEEVIAKSNNGLHYGNRIILPFRAQLLKAIIENDIVTDFSGSQKGAKFYIHAEYTEIYFHDYKNLEDFVTKYETIKLIFVENDEDIFNDAKHIKAALHLEEKHRVRIEKINDDILLIE
jgi:hypothetical protein